MALSPLQSRLAASLAASLLVLAIYLLLFSPQLAAATELPVRNEHDLGLSGLPDDDQTDIFEPAYQPEFAAFDRSIIGRAESGFRSLGNNNVKTWNLNPGETVCYVFSTGTTRTQTTLTDATSTTATATANEKRGLTEEDLTQRAATRKIYISANTCLQPTQTKNGTNDRLPPQLILAAGTTGDSACTKPLTDNQAQFAEGSAEVTVEAEGDIFITVTAPNVTEGFDGPYNFEIAASTDEYFHSYDATEQTALDSKLVHSDARGVLISTKPLTSNKDEYEKYEKMNPLPYKLFVENENLVLFDGLRRSICGMRNQARSFTDDLVTISMSTGGYQGPRQQFRFEGLNSSSSYRAVLVKMNSESEKQKRQEGDDNSSNDSRNGKVGGGGVVFGGLTFSTSSDKSSCKVVSGLEFCTGVSWAVPSSSSLNGTELGKKYDDYAKSVYGNFETVMKQVPCNESNSSRYSLIHTCDQCNQAYKEWLCTVTFPRCEDYSSPNPATIQRNVNSTFPDGTMIDEQERANFSAHRWHNVSRNQWIEENIIPGPYKEVLPCDEVCFEVVRNCPAVIQFSCPQSGYPGFSGSYARRTQDEEGNLLCNALGTSQDELNIAHLLQPQVLGIFSISLLVTLGIYL